MRIRVFGLVGYVGAVSAACLAADGHLVVGVDTNPVNSANCSPTVTADRPYVLGVSYESTAPTFFTLYRQDANGVWSYACHQRGIT